jgi:hypothetical protein
VRRLALVGALGAALAAAAPAAAAPFGTPTTISGFGNQPALAQISGVTLAADGASAVVGSASNSNARRTVAAFGNAASPPASARGLGPTSGAYDIAIASNDDGDVAITFSVRNVAYLTLCSERHCGSTQRVGISSLKPQSAVAVQPGNGRTMVLWRGRTSGGTNRLQWRITTDGRLGATHTLGEFGDTPKIATDDSGRTIAVWIADRRANRRGLRTAARRKGEFLSPSTLTSAPAADLGVVSSGGGQTVAAWLTARNGIDPEQPNGTVQAARRTRSTSFGTPQSLGNGSTLSLAGSPDGHALLATDRHVGPTSVVVSAARRDPGAAFGPMTDVAPAQFVSDAYGAQAAVSDRGRALVTWASGTDPSAPVALAGVFAVLAEPGAPYGVPQLLSGSDNATLPQPTGAAIGPTGAIVAWAGPHGGQVARATN